MGGLQGIVCIVAIVGIALVGLERAEVLSSLVGHYFFSPTSSPNLASLVVPAARLVGLSPTSEHVRQFPT